jgi:hypothetical protein
VDANRVVYRTVNTEGRPTTAGGLLAFPRTDVPSETTIALDVLRAADSYAPVLGRQLGRDVLDGPAGRRGCRCACARGVEAPLVDLGTPDYGGSRHLGSQRAGTASVVRWFASLR